MKHYPKSRQSAFTLIELLTVIAIVAILAAIILPAISKVRANARAAAGTSNLRNIGLSVKLYASENNNMLPYVTIKKEDWNAAHPDPDDQISGDLQWTKQLRDYLPQQSSSLTARVNVLFVCPNAEYYDSNGNLREGEDISRTYTATGAMYGISASGNRDSEAQRSLNTIYDPSKTILVADGKQAGTSTACYSATVWSQAQTDISSSGPGACSRLDFRHPGDSINLLYVDGHVVRMTFDEAQAITEANWHGRD